MIRAALLAAAVALAGCAGEVRPAIRPGVDACHECGMVVDRLGQACGFVDGGEFVTFDSPLCLLREVEARRHGRLPVPAAIWFADYADGTLHPVADVTFLLTGHLPTVMDSGAACFARRADAEAARQHDDETITDWDGFRLARGTPDRVVEVRFEPSGMVPGRVDVDKGELVLWKAVGAGLDRDLSISIRGYPEAGEIAVPASGTAVAFRIWAERPGAGFPVVDAASGDALGMLQVLGAHTADEEEM